MPVLAIGSFIAGVIGSITTVAEVAGAAALGSLGVDGVTAGIVGGFLGDAAVASVGLFALATASQLLESQPKVGGTQVDFMADPQTGVPYAIGRTGTGGKIVMTDSAGKNSAFLTYITVDSLGPIQGYESFAANTIQIQFTADNGEGANTQNATTTISQPVAAGTSVVQVGTTDGFSTGQSVTISGSGGSETRTLTRVDQSPKELTFSSGLSAAFAQYAEVTGPNVASGFKNRMWLKESLGPANAPYLTFTSTDSKDTPANHSGIPTVWTASCQLSGLAATMWTLEFDAQVYSGGTPRPLKVLKGVFGYDPRQDSTYPGGAGACRSTDETTWIYSENPYVHALTWLIGRKSNGVKTMGVRAPLTAIDIPAFVIGMNVADANGWTLGGVIMSTDSKWTVLTTMLQAGGGTPLKLAAKISCMVNTPLVSLDTLTGSDVVGKASIANTTPSRDRINAIWPRYREEQQGWQIVPTQAPVIVASYVAIDGGQRTKETEYTLCQNASQAATLARYDIENAREIQPITLPCKPRWMGYKPGDCITVNEPEYELVNQTCLIISREVDPATLTTTLGLRSETFAKHAFALGQTGSAPVTPAMNGFDPSVFNGPEAGAWTATGELVVSNGTTFPAIVVAGAVDNPLAATVITECSPAGDNIWSVYSEGPATTTLVQMTGLTPGAPFDVQIRYRSVKNVISDPLVITAAGGVTTGGIIIQVPVGGNNVVNSDWSNDATGWFYPGYSNEPTPYTASGGRNLNTYFGLRNVLWTSMGLSSGGAISSGDYFFGPSQRGSNGLDPLDQYRYGLACTGGDRLLWGGLIVGHGAQNAYYRIQFTDVTGASKGYVDAPAEGFVNARAGGKAGQNGDPANFYQCASYTDVPDGLGIAYAQLVTYGYAAGGDTSIYFFTTEPYLVKGFAGQTLAPAYTPGPPDRYATYGATTGTNLLSPTYGQLYDGSIYTPIGVAAGIAGQGSLATQSSVLTGGGQIYSGSYGTLYDGSIYTPIGTAAAIAGQGALATSTSYGYLTGVPGVGMNAAINSSFKKLSSGNIPYGWAVALGVQATAPNGQFYDTTLNAATASLAAGASYDFGCTKGTWFDASGFSPHLFCLPVTNGDQVFAACYAGQKNTTFQLYLMVYDASGTLVQAVPFQGATDYANDNAVGNGDVNHYAEVGGIVTISGANARWAGLMFRCLNATGATETDAEGYVIRPQIGKLAPGQTTIPLYQPGPSDPISDQTSTNVASGITGQGTLATANAYVQSTDPGSVPDGCLWADTSASPNDVFKIRVGGAWAAVANFSGGGTATTGTLSNTSVAATLNEGGWQTYGLCAFSAVAAGAYWTSADGELTTTTASAPSSGATATFDWRIVESPHGSTSYSIIASGSISGTWHSGEGWSLDSTDVNSVIDFTAGPAIACVNSGAVDVSLQFYISSPVSIAHIVGEVGATWGAGG